ncbi:MAG: hypothetical protein IJS62_07040 [Bacteroidales bacterium]|nr:hypothetical protein [Bacteroidales bacterium]
MRKLLIATFTLLGTLTLTAQPRQEDTGKAADRQAKREGFAKMQAQKIAAQLAFDEATTAKFTDTYMACQKEIWALGPVKDKGKENAMSEKETEESIKAQFERNEKVLQIRRKYYEEYSKFLSQKQIQRVYELEKQQREMMAGHGGNRGQGPAKGRRPAK